MIHQIKGDLLTAKGVILHGVNCQGVMGSGVAKAIREKWPLVFDQYVKCVTERRLFGGHEALLGTAHFVETDGVVVWNMFTQIHFRTGQNIGTKYASYDAIDFLLPRIIDLHKHHWPKVYNFPLLGSDRGGLHWPVVREIIDHRIPDTFTKNLYEL